MGERMRCVGEEGLMRLQSPDSQNVSFGVLNEPQFMICLGKWQQ